ncbi:tetratricopeptide repeat protein [soil metagenome]
MSIDILSLWNFSDPAESENRFRTALAGATPEEDFILWTQIARTHGLRKDFDTAKQILSGMESRIPSRGQEGFVRYLLELGRTHCSPAHPEGTVTDESRFLARNSYRVAFTLASEAKLDYLAVDALHMQAIIEPDLEKQILWNERALAYMSESDQPDAKKWEGSLRNNLGYALKDAHRYDEALEQFEQALAVRERAGQQPQIRIAKWMIANTLRLSGRNQEALEIQLELEKECEVIGETDNYVFQELEQIYRAIGDPVKADTYAAKHR